MKSQILALSRALPVTLAAAALAPLLGAAASASVTPLPSSIFALEKSEAAIADDIAFAKGLAKQWGFVDLAGEIIKRVEKEGVSAAVGERLGVVKCEIFAQGAIAERDRVRRNELFEQALSAYEDFLEDNPNSPSAPEARSGFITMSSTFARSLEISMEEAIGEEAEALRTRREEVLLAANDRTRSLIGELEAAQRDEPSENLKRQLINVMMMRAQINLEIGKSGDDGTFSFAEAGKILEDVTFLAGEGTPGCLRAYDMIGQVFTAQQDWDDAAIYFQAVVEAAIPLDPKDWAKLVDEMELAQSDKEQRWLFVELSTGGLINAMISNGDVADATSYAMHLYNIQRREGFEYSTSLGYPSLLAAAKVLLDAGGVIGGRLNSGDGQWFETTEAAVEGGHKNKRNRTSTVDLALRIAQQVVAENQTNILKVKAQKLIAEITSRPGIKVDPEVLYEAAEGKYRSGEDQEAIEGFKLVLAAIEGGDQAQRIELGPKTFFRLGRVYGRNDRTLEMALAYREGCTTYQGDPENDSYNATGYYRAMQTLTSGAPGDALYKTMYEEAETLAATFAEQDKDGILWDQGEKARRKKEYAIAISKYVQIQRAAIDYEKALVNTAVCKYAMGQKQEGYDSIIDYLEVFIQDDLNTVEGAKEAKRGDAMATAGYFRCFHEFSLKQYDKVIAHSSEYHKNFEDQTSFAPKVIDMVGTAYARTEKIAEAKQMLTDLMATYEESAYIAKLSITIYKALAAQRKQLESGSEADLGLALEMATLMELGNKKGSAASFANLRLESKHWNELANWDKAGPVLERIISKFGSDPNYEKQIVVYVKPDLAHAYLEQLKVSEASAVLSELMISTIAKPSKRTVLNYTRSVIGWVQGSASDIREVPGAGVTAEDYSAATDKLNALANSVAEKWECDWYNLKFQLAYGYYRWGTAEGGPKDSKYKIAAKSQLNALVQPLGNDFKGKDGVPGVNDSCDGDPKLALTLGDDVLRRRLVWLWGKVKGAK